MSLLSRLLGRADDDGRSEPGSVRAIAERLEELPPERARYLSAFAYVLARGARADLEVDEREVVAMRREISAHADFGDSEASLVVELALARAHEQGGTDNYVVTREFRRLSERGQRLELMRCLFAVAAADDSIESVESEEIHAIGQELGFTRAEVNGLRLEWREKLAELRGLPRRS